MPAFGRRQSASLPLNSGNECPVEFVSWEDAQEFINVLNTNGEGTYRLPTDAQWEYAARAGTQTAFASGPIMEIGCEHDRNLDGIGWYCGNSDNSTHKVGQKQPNHWGLYDMHGNVGEWCQDWFGDLSFNPDIDPKGSESGSYRVLRGGDWGIDVRYCRSANRSGYWSNYRSGGSGLRLVRLVEED